MVLLNSCILFTARFLPLERISVAWGTCKHGVPPRSCNSRVDTQGVIPLRSKSAPQHRAVAHVLQRGGNPGGTLASRAGNGAQQPGGRLSCSVRDPCLLLEAAPFLMQRLPGEHSRELLPSLSLAGRLSRERTRGLEGDTCDANGGDLLSDTRTKGGCHNGGNKHSSEKHRAAFSSESLSLCSFVGAPVVVAVNSSRALRSCRS